MMKKLTTLSGLGLALLVPVFAHPNLDEAILESNQQIEASPQDANAFLRRGELHRLHRDWSAAAADYDRAELLDPGLTAVRMARGRMFLDSGHNEQALITLGKALASHPVEARRFRAQVFMNLDRPDEAAADLLAVIALSDPPGPDDYLDCASAFRAAGEDTRALRLLNSGAATSGPAIESAALELEIELGHYQDALKRAERLTSAAERKETWLARQGEIFEKLGRAAEAREAYMAALAALESVPPARRQTDASQRLAQALKSAISRL